MCNEARKVYTTLGRIIRQAPTMPYCNTAHREQYHCYLLYCAHRSVYHTAFKFDMHISILDIKAIYLTSPIISVFAYHNKVDFIYN